MTDLIERDAAIARFYRNTHRNLFTPVEVEYELRALRAIAENQQAMPKGDT